MLARSPLCILLGLVTMAAAVLAAPSKKQPSEARLDYSMAGEHALAAGKSVLIHGSAAVRHPVEGIIGGIKVAREGEKRSGAKIAGMGAFTGATNALHTVYAPVKQTSIAAAYLGKAGVVAMTKHGRKPASEGAQQGHVHRVEALRASQEYDRQLNKDLSDALRDPV